MANKKVKAKIDEEEEKVMDNTEETADEVEETVEVKPTKAKKFDLDGEVAIVKNGELIRVYPDGSEDNVKSFLSKDSFYEAIDPSTITKVTVSWRESIKQLDPQTNRMTDTGNMATKKSIFTRKDNGAEWLKMARSLANEAPKRSCVVEF